MSSIKTIVKKITPKSVLTRYHAARYGEATQTNLLLKPAKLRLIDLALKKGARNFADLGGMWRVNGGYSIYCADHTSGDVVMVDFNATPEFLSEQSKRKNLSNIKENFALRETANQLKDIDCVMLFDVLLHQVKPDWNEVLENYAAQTKFFLIYNQQFTGPQTVRLVDQEEEWYLRHAPRSPSDTEEYSALLKDVFRKANEPHPGYSDGRPYKDLHAVWQWGITDDDLKRVMQELGFRLVYEEDCGWWPGLEEIKDMAFMFEKI